MFPKKSPLNVAVLSGLALTTIVLAGGMRAGDAGPRFIMGINTHFGAGHQVSVPLHLESLKAVGADSFRDSIYPHGWKSGGAGQRDAFSSRMDEALTLGAQMGFTPLIIFIGQPAQADKDIEAYAQSSAEIAAAHKGQCGLYQLWNEWDNPYWYPKGRENAELYVKFAKAAYGKIKAANPSATLIANSVCSGEKFLEDTLKKGVLQCCDGISFHSYEYYKPEAQRSPEAYVERIAGIDKLVKQYNGGKEFPLYLTETGWPTHVRCDGSTEEEAGDNLAQTYLLVKTIPAVKGLWWYDFQDDGLDPNGNENNFGIVRTDLTPKAPYYVMRSIAEIVKQGKFVERLKTADDALIALKFKMPDGQDVLAAWATIRDVNMQVTLKNTKRLGGTLKAFHAGQAPVERGWGMREWAATERSKSAAPFIPDRMQFTVRTRPFIVMGDLTGVELEQVKRIPFPESNHGKAVSWVIPAKTMEIFPASKPALPLRFGGAANYRRLNGDEPFSGNSLDASFSLGYDKDSINLVAEVTDDKFFQREPSCDVWKGDSVQVAFQPLGPNAGPNNVAEFSLALTERGPEVYRQGNPTGKLCPTVKLEIKRDGAKTLYTARFPVKELGLQELKPDRLFGFSILVNDSDGAGRGGYLHWGDGVGGTKDPAQYNWIVVKE